MLTISELQRRATASPTWRQDTHNLMWCLADAGPPDTVSVLASGALAVGAFATSGSITFATGTVVALSAPEWHFRQLVEAWRRERGAESSVTKIAMSPSYQKIIAMGPAVVPLILRELESEGDEPDHWFWALRSITDTDPVLPDARGDMVQMAQAWIDWGRRRYAW